jgi:hypothetical protein
LKTLRCRHRIGSTWSWQVTVVPARALSSGHNAAVSSTFSTNVDASESSRASITRQLFPSPNNCPNVSSGVIARHHPPPVKPPGSTGISEEPQNIGLASPLAISGNWTSRSAGFSFNESVTFDFNANTGDVVPGNDLSVYYNVPGSATQQFVTSAPPFTGTSSANMASYVSGFRGNGATGPIYMGFHASHGGIVGEWQIVAVPEPGEYAAVAGVALVAFGAWRRKSKTSAPTN